VPRGEEGVWPGAYAEGGGGRERERGGAAQTAGGEGDAREDDAVKHTRTTPANTITQSRSRTNRETQRHTRAHTNALLVETRTSALTLYGRADRGGGARERGNREWVMGGGEGERTDGGKATAKGEAPTALHFDSNPQAEQSPQRDRPQGGSNSTQQQHQRAQQQHQPTTADRSTLRKLLVFKYTYLEIDFHNVISVDVKG